MMDVHEQLRQLEMKSEKYRHALEAVPVVLGQLDNDGKDFLAVIMQACLEAGMEGQVEWDELRNKREKKEEGNFLQMYRIEHIGQPLTYWGECEGETFPMNPDDQYLGWTLDKGKARVYTEAQRKRMKLPANGMWVVTE